MRTRDFTKRLQHEEIVCAIRDAERRTSGEIRVFVSRRNVEDPIQAAQKEFERMGMTKTRERNGVLIYVAPKSRKFAVIGDEAVHRLCGESFWRDLAAEMTEHFKKSDFTQGIVNSIH